MQTCSVIEFFGSFPCADYWLQRYQPLLVGFIALSLATLQVWIASRSLEISRQLAGIQLGQQRLKMEQDKTAKAIATIAVDRVLKAAVMASRMVMMQAWHTGTPGAYKWHPEIMRHADYLFGEQVSTDDIEGDAVLAFPSRSTEIVQLANAYNDLMAIRREARDLIPLRPANADYDMHYVPPPMKDLPQGFVERLNAALNSLDQWALECGDLMPGGSGRLSRSVQGDMAF